MADFSSLTHKWRALPNNPSDNNKISKRNRQPVSCQPCRVRKLKCDRGHPCEACNKRGDETSCHYGKSNPPANSQHQSSSKTSDGRAQDRLRQLEDMVRQMIEPAEVKKNGPPTQPESVNVDSTREGPLNRERHGTNYTGSTHWSAILDQIQDLRTMIAPISSPDTDGGAGSSPLDAYSNGSPQHDESAQDRDLSLFGPHKLLPLSQLLEKYLPPRQNVDRLLSVYFNSYYIPMPYIHKQQFNRQYDAFWKDPTQARTSPMWLSILFSFLSMADKIRLGSESEYEIGIHNQSQHQGSRGNSREPKNDSPESDSATSRESPDGNGLVSAAELSSLDYLSASTQLLILGDYARPQPHLIEAMLIHIQAKYNLSLDPNREIALIEALIVRQAYSMSYHRDCSNFPPGQYSVFESEMRRRTWASIKQSDLMISFQLGIPMNVTEASWDTKPPRNLLDTDFDEDTKVLPEPRGTAEPTQMLYYVFKTQCMDVYAKILRHSLTFPQLHESQPGVNPKASVMDLDAEMRRVQESIPTVMKVKPMSLSFSDPSWLIMLRTNLLFLIQKSLCVLHRKYMLPNPQNTDEDSTYSRKVVMDASSKIVNHFLDLHQEFQPGGQLSRNWWMLGAFLVTDFLLAVMLLCFSFWTEREKHFRRGSSDGRGDVLKWLENDSEARATFEVLGKAKRVCEIYGKTSNESKRVAEVLLVILNNFASPESSAKSGNEPLRSESSKYDQTVSNGQAFRDRLDMTPLSIHDNNSSAPGHTKSPQGPRGDISDVSGYEATWEMVDAVPYKQQTRRSRPQAQNMSKQQQQTPQSTTPSTNEDISRPVNDSYMVPNTPQSIYDPLFSLMDTTNDSMPMDWSSFDQFIGNFSFNSASTPSNVNPYNGTFDPMSPPASTGQTAQVSWPGSVKPFDQHPDFNNGILGNWGGMSDW